MLSHMYKAYLVVSGIYEKRSLSLFCCFLLFFLSKKKKSLSCDKLCTWMFF
uniref:Uncharacterized protein n=1 Tax=Anguilla anguilla TaxID=7936 RepID=A0A0E9Q302_ANGAN